MTSLTETLPILDEAVPQLPGKVEAVAKEATAFDNAAREAIAGFTNKRNQAEALFEQVTQALAALREQVGEDRDGMDQAVQDLRSGAEEESAELEAAAGALDQAGDQTVVGFDSLASVLDQGGSRARDACTAMQAAFSSLADRTAAVTSELEAAVDAAVNAADEGRRAIEEGRADVVSGADALAGAFTTLLEQARTRLAQTRTRLEELASEQEDAVAIAGSELEEGGQRVEPKVVDRVAAAASEGVRPALQATADDVAELGQQLVALEAECQQRRDELNPKCEAVDGFVPPLQNGVEQVRRAAETTGIAWP